MITFSKQHRRYEKYRESGVEWLGKIPEGWNVNALKTCAPFVTRGNSPEYSEDDSGIAVINQACIYWDGLHLENIKYQQETDVTNWKGRLQKEDILINSTGTGTLGRVTVFQEKETYIADGHVTIIRGNLKKINASFIKYLLQTPLYQGYIYAGLVSGSTNQIELSREGLRRMPMILPAPEEQSSIASYLDEKCALIDDIIAKKQKQVELLKEKRAAIINRAVTRGLDEGVEMKESGVEWIGEIPAHWNMQKISRICRIGRGRVIAITEMGKEGYPVYSSQTENHGMLGYLPTYDFEGEYLTWTTDGANAGTVFYRNGKFNCTNVCGTLESSTSSVDMQFLRHALNQITKRFVRLDINPKLMNNVMAKIEVPLPPTLDEQIHIIEYIDDTTKDTDKFISKIEYSLSLLSEYKTSLIAHAVTGRIKVTDTDHV